MLLDQMMNVMEKLVSEIKEADPQKRDHFEKIAIAMLAISTEVLKQSPEFRRAFATVHSEFLRYPECTETLKQGFTAYTDFVQPH